MGFAALNQHSASARHWWPLGLPASRIAAATATGDRHMQWRLAEHVPLVHIGAGFNESLRDVPVAVGHGDDHGHDSRRIRQVHVHLVLEQNLDAGPAVLAGGVQQRREAAAIQGLRAVFCSAYALIIAYRAARSFTSAPLPRRNSTHLQDDGEPPPTSVGLLTELLARVDFRPAFSTAWRLRCAGTRDQVQAVSPSGLAEFASAPS